MFSLSQIKNKKIFFLHIILLPLFSGQCYGNGIYDGCKSLEQVLKDHPLLSAVVISTLGGVVTHTINRYYEDPEIKNLNIQLAKKDLELKNHPDYIETMLLETKIEAGDKCNKIEERRQALIHQQLQYQMHVEDRIEKFSECTRNGITPQEREGCQKIHDLYMQKYNIYFSAQT
jgi:hypothetical protein